MTKIHLILAQAQTVTPATPGQTGGGGLMMLGYALLLGAMFWFMSSSQRKKAKAHEQMLAGIKNGDEVITTGGIYGTVTSVKDDRFVVRIGDNNSKVEVGKGFISSVVKRADAA
jgi:preprotein translocase subunit YajC